MRCIDLAAYFICRICCDGSDNITESISPLQYSQYDYIQFARIFGVCVPHSNNVLRSGKVFRSFKPTFHVKLISFCVDIGRSAKR